MKSPQCFSRAPLRRDSGGAGIRVLLIAIGLSAAFVYLMVRFDESSRTLWERLVAPVETSPTPSSASVPAISPTPEHSLEAPASPAPLRPINVAKPVMPTFNHPCIPTTREELDTIKANLDKEPWKQGYAVLAGAGNSQLDYRMRGPFAEVKRNHNLNLNEWRSDMVAVHNLARMWYFTGKDAYAQKARDILIAWAKTQTNFGGQESGLDLGDFSSAYGGGASILRGTWPGWTPEDTAAVKRYFTNVLWRGTAAQVSIAGPANKGSLNLAAGIAIAVFCDDVEKFNHVIDVFRTYPGSGLPNSLPTGQMGETGRDAGHGYGDLLSRAFVAEVAWKQGIDLYSELDNRLLACGEYYARNTFESDNPFVPFGTVDYHYYKNADGPYTANRAGFYLLQNAYKNRFGLPTPWIDRKMMEQHVDAANFMYAKSADFTTATPLPPVVRPAVSPASGGLTLTTLGDRDAERSVSYSNGVWTVTGLGHGTWTDGADDCQFLYTTITGDCAFVARVMSTARLGSQDAKAGLMIRDNLAGAVSQRSWTALVPATAGGYLVEAYATGWTVTWGGRNWAKRSQPLPPGLPYWLKIERRGNIVTSYASQDGVSWSPTVSSDYGNLPPSVHIGIFVSSGAATPNTATFTHVAYTGGEGGLVTPPPAPAALFAVGSEKAITVRWLPAFGATAYDLLRSTTRGRGYTVIAGDLGTEKTSYVDTNVKRGMTYYYMVRAKNSAGASGYSPEFGDALLPPPMVNVAVGGAATASFNGDSDREGAHKAFDGNPGSKWYGYNAPTNWIQYDLGEGNAQVVQRYTINSADVPERDPRSWNFLGSQDGNQWTILDVQSNQSFRIRMGMNTYNIRNITPFRFYRLDITANNGAPGVAVSELGLWAAETRQ